MSNKEKKSFNKIALLATASLASLLITANVDVMANPHKNKKGKDLVQSDEKYKDHIIKLGSILKKKELTEAKSFYNWKKKAMVVEDTKINESTEKRDTKINEEMKSVESGEKLIKVVYNGKTDTVAPEYLNDFASAKILSVEIEKNDTKQRAAVALLEKIEKVVNKKNAKKLLQNWHDVVGKETSQNKEQDRNTEIKSYEEKAKIQKIQKIQAFFRNSDLNKKVQFELKIIPCIAKVAEEKAGENKYATFLKHFYDLNSTPPDKRTDTQKKLAQLIHKAISEIDEKWKNDDYNGISEVKTDVLKLGQMNMESDIDDNKLPRFSPTTQILEYMITNVEELFKPSDEKKLSFGNNSDLNIIENQVQNQLVNEGQKKITSKENDIIAFNAQESVELKVSSSKQGSRKNSNINSEVITPTGKEIANIDGINEAEKKLL